MAVFLRCRFAAAYAVACLSAGLGLPAYAQSPTPPQPAPAGTIPQIVVTATRTERAAAETGTAISVISADEIEKSGAANVGDLLRRVPGVTMTRSGGPGQLETVRIRGGDVRHTLVLIDGVRMNDPSATGREFDFSTIVLADVERIEVLRGPQSALYGSDALGGVINIITKRGHLRPQSNLSVEYGRYNTRTVAGGFSGGDDKVDYAFGFTGLESSGFSSFGYRVRRLRYLAPNGFEPDATARFGLTGRFGINVTDGVRLEFGGTSNFNRAQYDAGFLPYPDTPSRGESRLNSGYARLIVDSFDKTLHSTVTTYVNQVVRDNKDVSYFDLGFGPSPFRTDSTFKGLRTGAEYQGDLKLGTLGLLTLGSKIEREEADGFSQDVLPFPGNRTRTFAAEQVTRSAYALYQTKLGERLNLSFGGRIDDVNNVDMFRTWRATAAYELKETGTVFRASAGTGGKAPSLYQLYSEYGTPTLQSETSLGFDAGIDQTLWNDRVKLSATYFRNRYRNLIDFDTNPNDCRPGQFFGCYFNVARARTAGVELAADIVLVPEFLRFKAAYTSLSAIDEATHFDLARRPAREGRVSLLILPMEGLSIEPAIVFVGSRFSSPNERDRLPAYARFDAYASYKINETFSVFARAENLTGTHYEEVKNYGTAGRSFFAGLKATW